ncbi:MAG: enoyl-CoA hydratase [Chloroflexi bacterium]|nr:enoyl-CoA hydratase [Chloroflexota bacterium]
MTGHLYVKSKVEDRVAVLTIDHPPANALSSATLNDLQSAFDAAVADPEVKAIVITGAGPQFFVAGADIKEIAALTSAAAAEAMLLQGQAILNKLEASPKPVIAAVNGYALGGGLELAMACHIRVIAERARLGQPEINLGIIPGFGGSQRLPRLVGRGKALELLLTGDPITGKEAVALGLANVAVPGNAVLRTAVGLAKKIATKGAPSIAALLTAVREGLDTTLEEGLRIEATQFARLTETEDMREGLTAFVEKRAPKFKDR